MTIKNYPNDLELARKKRGLTQKRAAHLVGLKNRGSIARYERSQVVPSLSMALKLEILYRTPIAFLFPSAYEIIRIAVRSAEETGRRSEGRAKA